MSNIQAINLIKSYLTNHGMALKGAKPEAIVRTDRDVGWILPILTVGAGQATETWCHSVFKNQELQEACLALDTIVQLHGMVYEQSLNCRPEAMNGFKQLADYLDTDIKRQVYGIFTMSFMQGVHAVLVVPPLNRLGLTPDLARTLLEPVSTVPILNMLSADTRGKVLDDLSRYGCLANMPNVLRMRLETDDYISLIDKNQKERLAEMEGVKQ